MQPSPHIRALAALLLTVSCSRAPSRTAGTDSTSTDSIRADTQVASVPADSSLGQATPAPAPVPADTQLAARPATPAPAAPRKSQTSPAPKPPAARPAAPADTAPATTPEPQVADAPLRDAYHTAPLDTVDAKTYQGWKLFNLNCARCHGEDVNGTTIAPHLIVSLKPDGAIPDEETFQTTVCGGRVAKGMPSWCALGMLPATIDTIYAYVKGRSDAKIHPGRPARRN